MWGGIGGGAEWDQAGGGLLNLSQCQRDDAFGLAVAPGHQAKFEVEIREEKFTAVEAKKDPIIA